MSNSIFNTSRQTKTSGQVASSEYALITIGGRTELGQQVRGNYTRQIQTIFEIGSPNVMWLAGHEQGTLNFSRLVGSKGFFSGWDDDADACGVINPVAVDFTGGTQCLAKATGGLLFEGAMIESLDFSMQAGTLEITEGINLRVASISRKA